jgi:hypothetical protein
MRSDRQTITPEALDLGWNAGADEDFSRLVVRVC